MNNIIVRLNPGLALLVTLDLEDLEHPDFSTSWEENEALLEQYEPRNFSLTYRLSPSICFMLSCVWDHGPQITAKFNINGVDIQPGEDGE